MGLPITYLEDFRGLRSAVISGVIYEFSTRMCNEECQSSSRRTRKGNRLVPEANPRAP